jgi:hypothetical protein
MSSTDLPWRVATFGIRVKPFISSLFYEAFDLSGAFLVVRNQV